MLKNFCIPFICVLCVGAISSAQAVAQIVSPPTVSLHTGTLEGIRFGPAQNEVAFLGVPYAAPPINDLRWKPPQPVEKWHGTRQATHFGAACPQLKAAWLPNLTWNEDCLFLNVWTTQLSPNAKLPVVAYLHGGANTMGSAQMTPLGPTLSRLGVVVVSINYRLGPLGFLAHPSLTAESTHHSSGNYGLLDQVQALQWIHENISQFGGDPSRVTVMGQSAGAVDICLLMTSPLAANLFHRAILQSGECQSTLNKDIHTWFPYNSIEGSGESVGERFATDLGAADGPDILQKMRSIPAEKLLDVWSKDPKVHFDAIVDGWVVPQQPAVIFAARQQMHIPVLLGSNANEATVFGPGPKTIGEYRDYLRGDTGKYSDQEFQAYPAKSDADVHSAYLQLQSDEFAYGAYSMAEAMAQAREKAFLYYFTFGETGKRASLGAYHGEELNLLVGLFPNDWEHSRDDEKLGGLMRKYWTQFAKAGDPNSHGVTPWPAFEAQAHQCFELGRTVGVRPVSPALDALDHMMKQIIAEAETVPLHANSKD
jgi:para-nitrobenzyl esterase